MGEAQSFDDDFKQLMNDVKGTDTLTKEEQIHRLTRAGSTYFNLNPFDVLQAAPEDNMEIIKKKFKRLSILVHPDKNLENREDAQKAFDAVKKALTQLEDSETRKACIEMIEDAKKRAETELKIKRRNLKKTSEGGVVKLPEDDPAVYKEFEKKVILKTFADAELRKRQAEDTHMKDQQRQRLDEQEEHEKAARQREFNEKWEKSREDRVNNWQNFKVTGAKKSKKMKGFRPPKTKQEQR